jgi:GTP 3',8-cyclase
VRLTGGEPTLRPDLCELVRSVATVPGIARVGLTTNGWRLADIAGELRGAGLSAVNVSLDSLDPDRFEQVTGSRLLSRVVAGIEAALATGIRSVKVNVVLLPGLEEAELDRFLEWTREAPLSIRFIELMQTGENQALFLRPHMPVEEIRRKLDRDGWAMLPRDELDGPAASFVRAGHAGQIGIISAYAHGFCDSCNRLRVSSTGDLVLCLFGEAPVPLRPLLQRDEDLGALVDRIEEAVSRKPEGHRLREGCTGGVGNLAGLGG